MMDYAVQQTLNALAFGSEYALLALGLAIVFSLMNLVNFAHGEIITIAAYTMYLMVVMAVGHPAIVIPMALAAAMAGALLFERVAFRPVRYAPPTTGLLTAFGVSIIVQNAFLLFVSARPRAVPVLGSLNQTITINGFTIQTLQVMEFVIALAAMGALVVFLKRSTLGLAMRAASREFAAVRLMGIRANRVIATAFAISGLLAGIAAVFIVARRGSIEPDMGFLPVLKAFVACVIGGFGSLPGAVLGGFVLGFIEVGILISLPAEWGGLVDAVVFSLIGLILITRPQGLLGHKVELGDKE
jgi:branched-chain amino acid transport system permease protein